MFASLRFAPLFLLATSFVSAGVVVEKRSSTADIQTVFNTLKGSTDSILPQINTATASLATLSPVEARKRQSDDDIANLVAGILTDVTNALDVSPRSAGSSPAVDTSLNQVLLGLEILLAGVLNLVANLLVDVAGLLRSLALGLTLATLGL
ncbi:hypothetical protein B0H14DRAFT_3512329 [Mycena olivaceomarginata]|nr:hypothetical protein B0H14DRAFT_3512329 [Mycena olivaceomarginata]